MFINKTKKGFSIGEVMIATFILLVGVIGVIVLTVKSIGNISDGKKAVTAALLAQEGTELVRSVRDNTVTQTWCGSGNNDRCTAFENKGSDIKSYGWPSLLLGQHGAVCSVDYTLIGDGALICADQTAKEDLYINKSTYFYSHSSGANNTSDAHFKRKIFIKYETTTGVQPTALSSDEIDKLVAKVTSVVVWTGGEMPDTADNIESKCKISKHCAFAQTRLTSWINY